MPYANSTVDRTNRAVWTTKRRQVRFPFYFNHLCLSSCVPCTPTQFSRIQEPEVSRETGFSTPVTPPVNLGAKHGITTVRREYSAMRDDPAAEAKGVLGDNTIFGPIDDAKIT